MMKVAKIVFLPLDLATTAATVTQSARAADRSMVGRINLNDTSVDDVR
jgi:hypothetical protein